MKTAIYKALIDTPWGYFTVAVDSIEQYARGDIYSAIHTELQASVGLLRIKGDVKKSNRRILKRMLPIKNTRVRDTYWAWIVKVKGN